jgi:hypothetical protein
MHFNLRGALGIGVPVLLGGAVALGAAVLPANAQTFQDTALSASQLHVDTFGGGTLSAFTSANTPHTVGLTATGAVTWALHGSVPNGVSLSGATISYSGGGLANPIEIVADATDGAGNAEALELPVTLTAGSIVISGGPVTVSISNLAAANVAGTVVFSASSSEGNSINFAQSNLPNGLASGNPVLTYAGGTAAPGTYGGVVVTASDADGVVLHGAFTLTVSAQQVNVSNYGDEVNRFGNGFDVYQQREYPGAIIAGWTATQADPATHFLRNNGSHQGAFQYEYAPHGSGSGLCVSDPGGGWASDPLRDGLILTPCNSGPWQQFVPQSDGALRNVATGLVVNPNGTGAQLRGAPSPTPWGGSFYNWTPFNNLPG